MRITELASEHPSEALRFTIETREIKGKERTLAIPSEPLAEIHRDLNEYLRKAAGLGRGLSPVRNAKAHKSSRFFFQTDIKDAFPSIKPRRLAGVLCTLLPELGDYDEVVAFLERNCFAPGMRGLPQGAPASPVLFELYCRWYVDRPIRTLLDSRRKRKFPFVVYSRYVDDITISSRVPLTPHLCERIKKVLRGAGFAVHSNKTTYKERDRHDVVVTGARILRGGKLTYTRAFLESLKAQADLVTQNKNPSEEDMWRLQGLVNYFSELLKVAPRAWPDSKKGESLLRLLTRAEDLVSNWREARKKLRVGRRRFSKAWLDELRSRIDVREYIAKTLKNRPARGYSGAVIKTSCPFPKASCQTNYYKHRVLTVYMGNHPHDAKYFSCGCIKGDVVTFAMHYHGWSFTEACLRLAQLLKLDAPPEYRHPDPESYSEATQLALFE